MGNELITLNKILLMHNGIDGSTDGNSLINYFVSVAILAEMAVSKVDDSPWLVEEKLNNRRNNYEFDKHLQNMLLFLNKRNGVSSKCIECGNSNYYKTEIILDNSIYIHFCRSFDKNAKYNQPYLKMNDDPSKFGFCCFEYMLSKDKTKVTDISLRIPRLDKQDIKVPLAINFTEMRDFFKKNDAAIEEQLKALNWHESKADTFTTDNKA